MPHDGVGVALKQFIRQTQLDATGLTLQNAKDVVNLLHECLSSRPETLYIGNKRLVS